MFPAKLRGPCNSCELHREPVRPLTYLPCDGDPPMSIETFLTAALFKRDQAGRMIVYPNGVTGRGYFVPDAATERALRRTLMWAVVGSAAFGGIGMAALMAVYGQVFEWTAKPWGIAIAVLVVFNFAYRALAKRLTHHMAPAAERMHLVEAWKRQAEAMPRWYLWCNAILGPLMLVGSALFIAMMRSPMAALLGAMGMALFVVATVQAVYGLRRRPQEQT